MGVFSQFLITPFSRAGVALVLLTIPLVIVLSGSESVKVDGHYGVLSLLPAAVAILLAFLTRQVLFALLLGVFVGGLVVRDINILGRFMIPAIGSEQYALILVVYLWCLGGLLGLWTRTGGSLAFRRVGPASPGQGSPQRQVLCLDGGTSLPSRRDDLNCAGRYHRSPRNGR